MDAEKKKLTLLVSSDVIEKAKELGLNLSEITEKALKIAPLSFNDKNTATPDKLREAYADIFKIISKTLKKWGEQLEIGSELIDEMYTDSTGKKCHYDTEIQYILNADEVYSWNELCDYEPLQTWKFNDENLPIDKFYEPEKIIGNLVDTLYKKARQNKELINKLQILKNILELSELSK